MNSTHKVRRAHLGLQAPAALIVCLIVILAACSTAQPISPTDLMPADGVVAGWSTLDDTQSFDQETLFDYANGGSEFFFLYGFEQLAVRHYQHQSGTEMTVEIWRLATSDDAYGLFSQSGVETPIEIKNAAGAALEPGSMLTFWQDRTYALLRSAQTVPDADLIAFAEVISSNLPPGGSPPALLAQMPTEPKPEGPLVFFRQEMVIQDSLFLGSNNVLGLSPQTKGVLGSYRVGEETIKIILVDYPDVSGAAIAQAALQDGAVNSLLASRVKSNTLAAAFGEADKAKAEQLLSAVSIP